MLARARSAPSTPADFELILIAGAEDIRKVVSFDRLLPFFGIYVSVTM
jgi:hypothetical protein